MTTPMEHSLAKPTDSRGLFLVDFTKMLYVCSSFGLLGVESRDFSQAEKERTACKANQIHKMKTTFTQNGHRLSF